MKRIAIALLAFCATLTCQAATPWQKITHPVAGTPQSIGAFSNGCIVGAHELPLQSDTYQVMRTDQRRYFGHPDLILFIQRLGNQVHNLGLGTVLVGDMGMPAGGRFNGGDPRPPTGTFRQPPDGAGCGHFPATAESTLELSAIVKTAGAGFGFQRWQAGGVVIMET